MKLSFKNILNNWKIIMPRPSKRKPWIGISTASFFCFITAAIFMLAPQSVAEPLAPKPEILDSLRERCLSILNRAMESEDAFIRSAAVRGAGDSGDATLIDFLKSALDDPYPTTRLFAIQAIYEISPKTAFSQTKILLGDSDVWVQAKALELLGRSGEDGAASLIAPHLKSPDATVRLAAAAGLVLAGDKRRLSILYEALVGGNPTHRYQSLGYLGTIGGDEVVERLVLMLDHEEKETVFYALKALGEKEIPASWEALKKVSRHADSSVRYQAVLAMGYQSPGKFKKPLLDLCHDEDGMVRLSAAVSLRRLGFGECQKALEASMTDPDFGVRSAAARVLGKISAANRGKLIALGLMDGHTRVRTAAVRAAGMMGGPNAFLLLYHMLDDPKEVIRVYSAGNLIKLIKR